MSYRFNTPVKLDQLAINSIVVNDASGETLFERCTDAADLTEDDWEMMKRIVELINEASE